MAGQTFSATLNGIQDFTFDGRGYSWDNGYLSSMDHWAGNGPDINKFKLTLQGDFFVGSIRFGGNGLTSIVDVADGGNRGIDFLRLTDLGGTVELNATYVTMLRQSGNNGISGTADLTFGTAGAGMIKLEDGNDTVQGGSGQIDAIHLGGGNNTLTGGSGFIGAVTAYSGNDTITLKSNADQISVGGGNNRVTTGNGFVGSILGYGNPGETNVISIGTGGVRSVGLNESDDRVTIRSGGNFEVMTVGSGNDTVTMQADSNGNSLVLGSGNNALTLAAGSRISSVTAGDGNNRITLNGDSRIYLMKLDNGNNTVTTASGNVESFYSYGGNNTLNIGSGGVQQIVLSGAGGVHTLTAKGFIGSFQVSDNSMANVTLNGGARMIQLNDGDDTVTTGTDYVQLINGGNGDNVITLGTGGAGFIRTGDGDDLIRLNTMDPDYGVVIQGGGGENTVDFSQINAKMTISLDRYDYQNIGAPGGDGPPVLGYFSLVHVANLVGGTLQDRLTGNDDANKINGLAGTDIISGLSGRDLLIGGRGDDTLTGGDAVDTFMFSPGGGTDRITDFDLGTDLIDFTGAARLADISFVKQGTGVLLTVGTVSVLVDTVTVAAMQDVDNFVF